MQTDYNDVRHSIGLDLLKNLDYVLVVTGLVSPSIEAGNLNGNLVSLFYHFLLLLLNLLVDESLDYIMLRGWVQSLQNKNTLLFEIVSQRLFGPSLKTYHFVLHFI